MSQHPKPIYFKGDGEKGFMAVRTLMRDHHIYGVFFNPRTPSSKEGGYTLTNSYSTVDAVVRTIRNLIGRSSQYNPQAFNNNQLIANVIDIYNNTVHSAFKNKFTPTQMQADTYLEALYIRACNDELEKVEKQRLLHGHLTYTPGAILPVHLPLEKTIYALQKRRRNFDELATFVRYDGGNAVVDLLHPYPKLRRAIIPLYYTKFLAYDIDEYRQKYNDLFVIDKTSDNVSVDVDDGTSVLL
jgi:hypothetical protein